LSHAGIVILAAGSCGAIPRCPGQLIGLGVTYAARPPADDPSTPWLLLSALAAVLIATGLARIGPIAGSRPGRIGVRAMALFAAAHLIAIGDADLGVVLFSIFAVVSGIAEPPTTRRDGQVRRHWAPADPSQPVQAIGAVAAGAAFGAVRFQQPALLIQAQALRV
jgi:hypothetical protein